MARLATVILLSLLLITLGAGLAASAGAVPIMKDLTPSPLLIWPTTGDGEATDVAAAPGGVVYVCGVQERSGRGRDVFVRRVPTGTWTRYWDGSAHGADVAEDVAFTSGGVYVVGSTTRASGDRAALLLKYSLRGKLIWARTWRPANGGEAVARRVLVDGDGRLLLAGDSWVGDERNVFAAKFGSGGKRLWTRVHVDGEYGDCADACLGADGGLYIAGRWAATSSASSDGMVVRFTPGGRVAWTRVFDAVDRDDQFTALCRRPDGGVFVAGTSETAVDDYDGIIVRYTAKGAGRFIVRVGGGDDHFTDFLDLARTTDGKLVACGSFASGSGASGQFVLASYSTAGAEEWYRTWASATGSSEARLVTPSSNGGVVVTGPWGREGEVRRLMTYFVDRLGLRRARCEWAGPIPGNTRPNAVSVRGSNAWVAGACDQLVSGEDGYVMRLAP